MTDHVLPGDQALLGVARDLLMAARAFARRPRRPGPLYARVRFGPAWAWCWAEQCDTPHHFDAGQRRCLACKTTTTSTRETPRG